jgi:arylsulfatase A-like enzyme
LTDIYPTILNAAGVELEPGFAHGDSLLKLVRGEQVQWHDDIHVESYGTGHLPTTMFTGRFGDIKYGFNFGGTDELYDLSADPYELDNRIDDPAYADVLADMRRRMRDWMERTHYHPHGIREFTRCRSVAVAKPQQVAA